MSITYRITVALIVVAMAGIAHGAEFKIHPSISVSEEYNDNVFETRDNRVTDYITHASPGISMSYEAPVLKGGINYTYDYMYYAKRSHSTDTTHALAANGLLTIVENLLFLDLSDNFSRVSTDVTRDVTQESPFLNQTDQNVATVSPYITLRPSHQTTIKTGYRYVDVRYFDPTGFDKTDHTAFFEGSYEFTPKWSATCEYDFTHEQSVIGNFNRHQPNLGFRYEYANKSFLFAQGGYTWISYDDGHRLNSEFWNAGITHNFDTFTTTVSTGIRYDEDPRSNITQETFVTGNIDKQMQRGSLGLTLNYSEFAVANTDTLQTKKYGGIVRGSYEFTKNLHGNVSFTAEKYDQRVLIITGSAPLNVLNVDTYTRRLLVVSGLSYLLAQQLNISLSHTYVDYYSPDIPADNKQVNRVTLAITKTF